MKALIQFTLNNDNDTFEATYLSFNDVPQSNLMLWGLIEKAFEPVGEAVPTATPVPTPQATATPTPVSNHNIYYSDSAFPYYTNAFHNSGIYVRSEPSKQSSPILYIQPGNVGEQTMLAYWGQTDAYDYTESRTYVWYLVEIPSGEMGYVRSDVVIPYGID